MAENHTQSTHKLQEPAIAINLRHTVSKNAGHNTSLNGNLESDYMFKYASN